MGRCQTDKPQNIRKTASGYGGVPQGHRAQGQRNRSYAIQFTTISRMLRGSGVHIYNFDDFTGGAKQEPKRFEKR